MARDLLLCGAMRLLSVILLIARLGAQTVNVGPGGVLNRLTIAQFAGSGTQTIQAMISDAVGNVYVAGTTSSPDLPVKNAAQPAIGESTLMRSVDRGVTWQTVPGPAEAPLTISPHPTDSQTLFAGGIRGIFKTTDGGQAWRRVYSYPPFVSSPSPQTVCCYNIVIDPGNTQNVYAFRLQSATQFLASSDGGESWQQRNLPFALLNGSLENGAGSVTASLLWVDPTGSGTLGLDNILSQDRGLNWTAIPPQYLGNPIFSAPDPRNSGRLYLATVAGAGGSLYLIEPGSFTLLGSPVRALDPVPVAIGNLLFDPDFANIFYAADLLGGIYVSEDSGGSWASPKVPIGTQTRAALLSRQCDGGALLAGVNGQVLSSFDFGMTLQPPALSRVVDLVAGPACTVYVARSVAADAFVAKLTPTAKRSGPLS